MTKQQQQYFYRGTKIVKVLNNKYFIVLISAFFTGLSQHNILFGFLNWFSLVPLILVLTKLRNYKQVFIYTFIWGFVYSFITVFWIAFNNGVNIVVGIFSMVATVLVLSSNTIIVGLIWFKLKSLSKEYNIFLLPFVWVSVEYIRSYGVLGFPWINLANSQTGFLYLIQNSEYVGIYGISFWIVIINCLLLQIVSRKSKEDIILFLSFFILPFISGFFILRSVEVSQLSPLKVSMIQPNISLEDKRNIYFSQINLDNLIEKSKKHILLGSKLIIWPESALPFKELQNKTTANYVINNLLYEKNTYLLSGDITKNKNNLFNSGVLLSKNGIEDIYHKKQLVPMGEYVPLSDKIDFLKNINFGQTNFLSGTETTIFKINDLSFSTLICFESTFPDINRIHAKKGIDFFVYLVNDGWYTSIYEPRQHARQSIYRAIENRKSVLRCANTGISMVIEPSGKIKHETALNTEDIITTFITESNTITFYTKYGNVFAYLVLVVTSIFLMFSFYKNEKIN